jgi:hypothetical protein
MAASPLFVMFRRATLLALAFFSASAALAQDVELYDQPRFAGTRLRLAADAPDLAGFGMGGRVASVVVQRGQWEFCTAARYGGNCITVGPGRYSELPPALRGTLMSVRSAGAAAAAASASSVVAAAGTEPSFYPGGRPADASGQPSGRPGMNFPPGGPGGPGGPGSMNGPAVVLFEFQDFTGAQLAVNGAATRLSDQGFNDKASAVEIRRGRWQLCQHSDFQGECQVLNPGRHVLGGRLFGSLSSLRPVAGADNRPWSNAGAIVLFEHGGFVGRSLTLTDAAPNLGKLDFNDRTSSIEVQAGQWELCMDADYKGSCIVLGPGRHNVERAHNDRISSVRPRPQFR